MAAETAGVERTPTAPTGSQADAAGSLQEGAITASADVRPEVAVVLSAPSQAPSGQHAGLRVETPAANGSTVSGVEAGVEGSAPGIFVRDTAALATPACGHALGDAAAVGEPPSTEAGVSGAAADGAAEGGKRKREAITWTLGGAKAVNSAAAKETGEAAEEDEPESPKRLRPNPAFLPGLITSIQRTNERLLADNAANAACQGIAVAASGGAKAQLDRAGTTDHAKIRRAALSVAAQQNLANCAALLKEIAAHYGFFLTVADDFDTGGVPVAHDAVGKAANGLPTPVSQPGSILGGEDERGGSESSEGPQLRPLNPLSVRLGLKRAHAPNLQAHVPVAEPLDVRPKPSLALNNNRLAGAALSAINLAAGPRDMPLPRKSRLLPSSHQVEDPQDGLPDSLSDFDNDDSPAPDEADFEEQLSSADGSEGIPLPRMRADRDSSSPAAAPQRKGANGSTSASPGGFEEAWPQGSLPAESGKEIGNLQGLLARAMHQKQQAAGSVRQKRPAAVSWDDRLAEANASDAGNAKASVERGSAAVDVGALFARAMQQRQDASVPRPARAGSASLPIRTQPAASSSARAAEQAGAANEEEEGSPRPTAQLSTLPAAENNRLPSVQAGALPTASSAETSSSEEDAAAEPSQPLTANRKPALRSVAKTASGAPDTAEAAEDRWQPGDGNKGKNPSPAAKSSELGKVLSEAGAKPGQKGLRTRGRPNGLFGAAMNSLGR